MEEISKDNDYLSLRCTNQLKGLAIILVIVGHLYLVRFSAAWGVAIFLIVSGFGLTQSYYKSGLKRFFNKRISKILIPYFFVTLIWLIIDLFLLKIKIPTKLVFLSLIGINIKCVFDLSMWYITFILLWYVIFYFTFLVFKNNIIKIFILFLFSVIMYKSFSIIPENINHNFFVINFPPDVGVPRYVIDFPIGVLIGLLYNKIIKINKVILLKIQSLISFMFFIIFYYLYHIIPNRKIELLECACFAISIISFFAILSMYSVKLEILEFIGKLSYEIYLFEYVFIEKYKFIFSLNINPWLRLVIYFTFIITISYLFKIFIDFIINFINKNINKIHIKNLISFAKS